MNTNVPPAISAAAAAIRYFSVAAGMLLLALHWEHTAAYEWVEKIGMGAMVVVPAAWGVWVAGVSTYKKLAVAVQAGINLTLSGQAVDHDGNPISNFAPDATPPKQVTVASATEIVKNFGPAPGEIVKN